MDLKAIATLQSVSAGIDATIQDKLAAFSLEQLVETAEALSINDNRLEAALRLLAAWPKDGPTLLAVHFYRELFRRIEVSEMESEQKQ